MVKSQTFITVLWLLIASNLCASGISLDKSSSDLSDFYNSCSQIQVSSSTYNRGDSAPSIPSSYRDVLQYESIADTIFVKVFITIDGSCSQAATQQFREMKLRSLKQFGNIFAAKIKLASLPELDKLTFVQRIEPVVPDGVSARASLAQTTPAPTVKKK